MKKNDSQKLMLAGLAVAGYFLLSSQPAGATGPAQTTTVGDDLTKGYPITYNHKHPGVKLIQKALGLIQDGIFGPLTLAAWRKIDPAVDSGGQEYEIDSYEGLQSAIEYINRIVSTGFGITGTKRFSTLG